MGNKIIYYREEIRRKNNFIVFIIIKYREKIYEPMEYESFSMGLHINKEHQYLLTLTHNQQNMQYNSMEPLHKTHRISNTLSMEHLTH